MVFKMVLVYFMVAAGGLASVWVHVRDVDMDPMPLPATVLCFEPTARSRKPARISLCHVCRCMACCLVTLRRRPPASPATAVAAVAETTALEAAAMLR